MEHQNNMRDKFLNGILLSLGISPKLKGYMYLRQAVAMYARQPGQAITKQLYFAVAAQYKATVPQVERDIRTAIIAGWQWGDPMQWQQYFPALRRPTNAAVICRIAILLMMEEGDM